MQIRGLLSQIERGRENAFVATASKTIWLQLVILTVLLHAKKGLIVERDTLLKWNIAHGKGVSETDQVVCTQVSYREHLFLNLPSLTLYVQPPLQSDPVCQLQPAVHLPSVCLNHRLLFNHGHSIILLQSRYLRWCFHRSTRIRPSPLLARGNTTKGSLNDPKRTVTTDIFWTFYLNLLDSGHYWTLYYITVHSFGGYLLKFGKEDVVHYPMCFAYFRLYFLTKM